MCVYKYKNIFYYVYIGKNMNNIVDFKLARYTILRKTNQVFIYYIYSIHINTIILMFINASKVCIFYIRVNICIIYLYIVKKTLFSYFCLFYQFMSWACVLTTSFDLACIFKG